ncbi:MAG TPA: YceI family protein [Anaeromyxobacteraceae bacterium]|nr:YceI family protein [Anaeromyxobacteraceae bacterium]
MKALLLLALASGPVLGPPGVSTWCIDPAHTSTEFSAQHLAIATVRGAFGRTTGTIRLDERDLRRSSVEAEVDVRTIDTRVAERDQDLKSEQFLDVARYPTITFKSTQVEKAGENRLRVAGELTMKGTTRPVVFDVTYSPMAVTGVGGETRRGFSGTFQVSRRAFGLSLSKAAEAGPLVGDEITITVDAEAVREEGPSPDPAELPPAK